MKRIYSELVEPILFSVMCISLVSANFTKAEVPKGTFVVDGTLVDKSGTPVTNQTVYVFPFFENAHLKIQYEQGRIANPRGTTDVKGKFQITVPLDFVKLGENFTLGIQEFVGFPSKIQTRSLTRNGVPLVLSVSKDDTLRKVPVGDIVVETNSNVQSIQAAKQGDLQAVKTAPAEGDKPNLIGKPPLGSQKTESLLISGPVFNSRDAALRFRPSAVKIIEITEKQALSPPEGTKAIVLAGNSEKKQVRILEGAHKDETVWVFTPFLQPEDVILTFDANSKSVLVWEDADWDPRKDNPDSYIGFRSQSEGDVKMRLLIGLAKHGAGKATVPFGTKAKWVGGDSKFAKVQVCEGYYKDKTVGTLTENVTIPIGTKATLRGSPETVPFTDAVPAFKTEQAVDSAIRIASDVVTVINKEGGVLLQKTQAEILTGDGIIKKVKILEGEHAGTEGWIATEQIRTQRNQIQDVPSLSNENITSPVNVKIEHQSLNLLPAFSEELQGSNPVRVKNPNSFAVSTGLRSGGRGKNFDVSANGEQTVYVPNGRYDIYFVYSDKPDALFQGDSFTLNNDGVEIQIVKVVNGNYNIRQVK
jgi:hypothetical protein